ncbi:BRCA2 repeat-containing protein, putative [Eimeria tenella]|uniref:BRCA2 repeat-containing protein, putative n=1 Tax=Eimeria tenella TaxID=5802 RepID=U6KMB8_EIMTE|nr:BRCA2 repeat-containing protein, putative [Eimeria tenella]CDJ39257.1 BRCA2 repeat-containing protein, putative [Eimeria tenella]|eukprot:XP_013230012.1 BRCA2 repeat-containing protein, putative [Eimeria tenella]
MFCCALREQHELQQQQQQVLLQRHGLPVEALKNHRTAPTTTTTTNSSSSSSSSSASLLRFDWRWFCHHYRLLAFFLCLRWRQQYLLRSLRGPPPPPPSPLLLLQQLLLRAAKEADGWRSCLRRICEGDAAAALPLALGVLGWRDLGGRCRSAHRL